jgi:hypothetical protein
MGFPHVLVKLPRPNLATGSVEKTFWFLWHEQEAYNENPRSNQAQEVPAATSPIHPEKTIDSRHI